MAEQFDLVVVGGGPGGYVAAIRASQLKMKVALVERENLGGICLNWGCIPTKALLRASEINHMLHSLDAYGFAVDNPRFDFAKVIKRSRNVANQLSSGVKGLMKKHKITVFDGHAKLAGPGKVSVSKDGKPVAEVAAKNIILATGARARVLPGLEPDGKLIWSYREALVPDALPKKLHRHRLGRDRVRVRVLLPQHGLRGDADRGDGPHPARSRMPRSPPSCRRPSPSRA